MSDPADDTYRPPQSLPPPEPPEHGAPVTSWVYNGTLFAGGALYGLLMRAAFGLFNRQGAAESGNTGVMLGAFLFFVPFVIGCITVAGIPREKRRAWRVIFMPWVGALLFIFGCAVLLFEGAICLIMAAPIFLVMSSLGGLVAWAVLHATTRGPPPMLAGGFLLLPLVFGAIEQELPVADTHSRLVANVHVNAAPDVVWRQIHAATDIRGDELGTALVWSIGVPRPLEGRTVSRADGRVRLSRWERGVHFAEPIVAWDENRYVRWRYEFAPDSIPAGALDEHVAIGGRYFDLLDSAYRLTPEDGGTRVELEVNYRVSTHFNWYANTLARVFIGGASRSILDLYKKRAERPAQPAP